MLSWSEPANVTGQRYPLPKLKGQNIPDAVVVLSRSVAVCRGPVRLSPVQRAQVPAFKEKRRRQG